MRRARGDAGFRVGGAPHSGVPTTLPPFALAPPVFRFRHLAALAGRAPIGGAREVALAAFVVARLAAERVGGSDDERAQRAARSMAAKGWLGTLSLPQPVRSAVTRCADLSVDGERSSLSRDIRDLALAASSYLDARSRNELESLARALGD
jgi:hypothetical protein